MKLRSNVSHASWNRASPVVGPESSFAKWYFYHLTDESIDDDATRIHSLVECLPDTPRANALPEERLTEIRRAVDKHITDTYLKKVQAPAGISQKLIAWMELT